MSNNQVMDYMNTINPDESPAGGEDVGNGTSEDYIIPDASTTEDIKPESELPVQKAKPLTNNNPPPVESTVTTEEKKAVKEEKTGGFLGLFKKKKKPQEQPQEPPKAVMPKKE